MFSERIYGDISKTVRTSVENDTPQTVKTSSGSKTRSAGKPTLKHVLIALTVPLAVLLLGVLLFSIAALVGLILIIVAIALAAGIVMAALRISYQKHSDAESARWKTRTLPLTSLVLIAGLATLIFFWFAN